MEHKIKAVIVGYGHIGAAAEQALLSASDFELLGVVRRHVSQEERYTRYGSPMVHSVAELGTTPQVALLTLPSRLVPSAAPEWLRKGIATVDSFDIHSDIPALRRSLAAEAKAHGTTAILSAGWDPGSDSMIRTLLEAMMPKGLTYTNFGPGMSMGHSVAVKMIEDVRDALSVTIPLGTGLHRRMVYVALNEGASEEAVREAILRDPYFVHDETYVSFVKDVDSLRDQGHAVHMIRKGVSGDTHNQLASFDMTINNPALTGQIMVAAARAALRMPSGAYTLPEVAPIDLLPGYREEWIERLC